MKKLLALIAVYSGVCLSQPVNYNSPYIGTPSTVFSNNPQSWVIPQAQNNSNLLIGANYAWSRGWTGQGTTILIMDTGIDLNSTAFNAPGKIVATLDLSGTGIQDTVGHGSNVAGIAAGAMTSSGVMGVAFNANLAVAKLSDTVSVTGAQALKALAWANTVNSNIVVANFSANTSYSTAYIKSVSKLANGIYASSDKTYGGSNYYNLETPKSWAAVLSPKMVLTVSAGNTGLPYVQNPATFATATNTDGSLVLNGQMLVVGNWNAKTQKVEGNTAGTVCKNVVGEVCKDIFKTSDFYILAPGMSVTGPVPTSVSKTGYANMSGTSQAAPAVAGAVAIISQLWPYMSASQQVQLLLKTANKNIPNYDPNIDGQGLLDLNRATQPIGNLGLALNGRTGSVVPLTGAISLSKVSSAATLSSISVVDVSQRDFKVDVTPAVAINNLMKMPIMLDADPGYNWSGRWTGLVAGQNLQMPLSGQQYAGESTLTLDSKIFDPDAKLSHQLTMTNSQYNPYVYMTGMFGQTKNSTTFEYSSLYRPGKKDHKHGLPQGWWAQGGIMSTVVNYDSSLVTNISPIVAVHAMAGYQYRDWNLFAGIKPLVAYGKITMSVPTSVDDNGTMIYSKATNSLAGCNPIPYIGVKYQHSLGDGQIVGFRSMVAADGTMGGRVYYSRMF